MDLMSILLAMLVIIIVGVILLWVNKNIQMQPAVKQILNIFVIVVLVVALILWLMHAFGISLGNLRIG